MDKWVEDFQKKNGRPPTPAEWQAHAMEQGSASGEFIPVQQPSELSQLTEPEQTVANPNIQAGNVGDTPQQQETSQNAVMMQQRINQSGHFPTSRQPSKAGSKRKRFFLSPLGISLTTVAVLLIAFVMTGFLTARSRDDLRTQYESAIRNRDVKALLALFPREQTESRFAEIGAKQLIDSKISFDKFRGGFRPFNDDNWRDELPPYTFENYITIVENQHLLFFKSYSLSTRTTKLDKGDTPEGAKLSIENREMTDKDFESEFFLGIYKIKAEVKTDFGGASFTDEFAGGEYRRVHLNFDIKNNYVSLPAGPDSFTVSYRAAGVHKTDIKLSNKTQKIGPFSKKVKDDEDTGDPTDFLFFSGEYGGVKIKNARLSDMRSSKNNFEMGKEYLLQFDNETVTYDKKKLNPYIEAHARKWFESGQTDAKEGSGSRENKNEIPPDFSDKNFKYMYKGCTIDNTEPYRFFVGYDEHLYVIAKFKVLITKTAVNKQGAKPVNSDDSREVVFRLDKDGKMKSVGEYLSGDGWNTVLSDD